MIGDYIGNYRLTRLLGEGGMGMVYEAVHDGVGGHAAIKVLRPEVAIKKDATARLFNEARAANSISHPGIVRVFDCGYTSQGVAYLAMEYLEGESLRARIERERSLRVFDALRIGRQIASALQAAHRRQVVHRDLKPDNIMLVPDPELPGGERVKLLDFGVAKLAETLNAEPLQTRSDTLMGTPTYMAPEQCRGAKHVTDRSDVYSLGVILYQLLSGVPPFLGESVGELIAMHLADVERPLAELAPHVKPEICTVIHAMLRKKPAERPSVDEVASELKRLMIALSESEGVPTGQAQRLASESAIPIGALLNPGASAALRGNMASPTMGEGSGTTPPGARLFQPTPAEPLPALRGAGLAGGPAQISPPVAHSTTWDGEAISHYVPTQPMPLVDGRAAPGSPSTVSPSAALAAAVAGTASAEASPVSAELLASAATPRKASSLHASPSASTAPEAPTARKEAASTSRLPWFLAGVAVLALGIAVSPLGSRPSSSSSAGLAPPAALRPPVEAGPPSSKTNAGGSPATKDAQLAAADATPSVPATDLAAGADALPVGASAASGSSATAPGPASDTPPAAGTPSTGSKLGTSDGTRAAPADGKKLPSSSDANHAPALAALRAGQFEEAGRLARACVEAKPQNYRCWWILGTASCHQNDRSTIASARSHLADMGKSSLVKEVDETCLTKSILVKSDGSIGSLRVVDDQTEWLNSASHQFETGKYLDAQRLAEKHVAVDPANAWSMIGRSACALGDAEKANQAIGKHSEKAGKNDIIFYCVRKGFAYNVASGLLSKRAAH